MVDAPGALLEALGCLVDILGYFGWLDYYTWRYFDFCVEVAVLGAA